MSVYFDADGVVDVELLMEVGFTMADLAHEALQQVHVAWYWDRRLTDLPHAELHAIYAPTIDALTNYYDDLTFGHDGPSSDADQDEPF